MADKHQTASESGVGLTPLLGDRFPNWASVVQNDATVARADQLGIPSVQIVVALANEKARLIDRLRILESIAPKKHRLPDGSVVVWRCPDDLIPESALP